MNWRQTTIIFLSLVIVVGIGVGITHYGADSNEPSLSPASPAVTTVPTTVTAPAPVAAAPSASATPPAIPPEMATIVSKARDTPMDRPMTEVAKPWLGCRSKETYQDTVALLARQDPAAAASFKGPNAACTMLATGQQVLMMGNDEANHLVQFRLGATGDILWSDPSALDGGK